ncbi:CGL83 [Auxenochlorella protothecoides x Auxenochlorella symbiontica]
MIWPSVSPMDGFAGHFTSTACGARVSNLPAWASFRSAKTLPQIRLNSRSRFIQVRIGADHPVACSAASCLEPFSANPLVGTGDATPKSIWASSILGVRRQWSSRGSLLLQGAAPLLLGQQVLGEMCTNRLLLIGMFGCFLAQFLKIFTKWRKTGTFSLMAILDSGGMPSSHSSLCSSLSTAVALQHGLASPLFAICFCFGSIVMYDAMGVRRHAGLQAEVLNAVVADLLAHHPVSERRKLKEVLGHTPAQVVAGAALGLGIGLVLGS